jgi:diadenosine tetraphosphatase ApaH/serine/threonine PP2A family protein phosphatase
MKLGIISDVHGNIEALDAILRRLETERADDVFCLGDIVGYGASPNECVERVHKVCRVTMLGNHDDAVVGRTDIKLFNPYARVAVEWTRRVLAEENLEFLRGLPFTHEESDLIFVHATPSDPRSWDYCLTPSDAAFQFEALRAGTTCFIGHSHVPVRFDDSKARRTIINVGSVGQPRDHDARATCGLYDTETGTFSWVRDVYPIQEAARKIRLANLPEFLATRLFDGT